MPPLVLSIAGSDPGGGAGIQADLKTLSAFGVHGAAAVTAITVQDGEGVSSVDPVDADLVSRQVRAVLRHRRVKGVKTGMLVNAPIVVAVAGALQSIRGIPLVVDPVLRSSSGHALLDAGGTAALLSDLLPLALLVTPNREEAALLAGVAGEDFDECGARLLQRGAGGVLITGGDAGGEQVVDLLYTSGGRTELTRPRVNTSSTHGTGCALSSALAALLARGRDLETAVRQATAWIGEALTAAPPPEEGCGAPNHLFPYRGPE